MADGTPLPARWVQLLLEPCSRKQALQEISVMEPASSDVALILWEAFGAVASLVKVLISGSGSPHRRTCTHDILGICQEWLCYILKQNSVHAGAPGRITMYRRGRRERLCHGQNCTDTRHNVASFDQRKDEATLCVIGCCGRDLAPA